MSTYPSPNYLMKLERWIYANGELSLQKMNMRVEQQYRSRLCLTAFYAWMQEKQCNVRTLITNIARRDYAQLVREAALGNEDAKYYVDQLPIRCDGDGNVIERTVSEIRNDIYVFNWIVGKFDTPKKNIHKAVYEDAAMWLINYGMKNGDPKSVDRGADKIARINNDFKEEDNAAEQMPNTDINITGDVSVVKTDRVNLSDEEKERLRKKYGLTAKEMTQELEEVNGVWQQQEEDEDDAPDIFDENLQQ